MALFTPACVWPASVHGVSEYRDWDYWKQGPETTHRVDRFAMRGSWAVMCIGPEQG